MSQLGEFVAKRRKEMRITVRAFSEKTGLSLGYIGYLESDQRYPTNPEVLMKIAEALELTENEKIEYYDMIASEKNWIPADVAVYLEGSKKAQVALRTAGEKNITDKQWDAIIKIMNEGE